MKRSKPRNSASKSPPAPRKRQTADELRALQRLMAGAVMRPLDDEFRMQRRWTDGRRTEKVIAEFIKPNDRLTSFDRLEIYNRQYWFRILDCFYDDFQGLRALLGSARFQKLATAYLAAVPSTSFTLRNLGRGLVDFLTHHPRYAGNRQTMALEMARLEWAHVEAFDNAAETPLTTDDLLDFGNTDPVLRLQPHLTLLALQQPLDDYLIALRRQTRQREDVSNAVGEIHPEKLARIDRYLKPKPAWVAVHRHENRVYYKRLTARQFQILDLLRQGVPLGAACEQAWNGSSRPMNAAQIQRWFQEWSRLGWFVSPRAQD